MLDMTDELPLTAGAWLRQQREAADISLETLSVALKVRPERLHALESDQLGDMPDGLFVRSLALGICRHLKADERALLPLLPQPPQRDLRVGRNQVHASPYNPNRWSGPMLFSPKRWPLKGYAGGAALVLLILLWVFWPADEEIEMPLEAARPSGASRAEGAAVSLAPTTVAPVPVLETPPIPVPAPSKPSSGNMTPESKGGKPQPLTENVVITPVTPLALQQNLPHLPTQTTKP
jgi:cytoskeleton protein RodZ